MERITKSVSVIKDLQKKLMYKAQISIYLPKDIDPHILGKICGFSHNVFAEKKASEGEFSAMRHKAEFPILASLHSPPS